MSTQYERESRKQLYVQTQLASWILSEKNREVNGNKVPPLPCLGYLAEVFEYSKDSIVGMHSLIPLYVFMLDENKNLALCEHVFSRSSGDQPFGCLREATIWKYSSPNLLKTLKYLTPAVTSMEDRIEDIGYIYGKDKSVFIQVVKIKGSIPKSTMDRSNRGMSEETLEVIRTHRNEMLKL